MQPTPPATIPGYDVPIRNSGLAVTSLVMGGFGVLTGCVGIGALLGLVAAILGVVALLKIGRPDSGLQGKGFAITGIILGVVAVLMLFVFAALLVPALHQARNAARQTIDGSQLRQVGIVMMAYSHDDDVHSVHPRDLVPSMGGGGATMIFRNPYQNPNAELDRGDFDGGAVRYGGYVFLSYDVPLDELDPPHYSVLAYTAKISSQQTKRNVLFADGRVEQMDEGQLRAILPQGVEVDALDGP